MSMRKDFQEKTDGVMGLPTLLTVKGACKALSISRTRLYQLMQSRDIVAKKLGGRTYIPKSNIEIFIENMQEFKPRK